MSIDTCKSCGNFVNTDFDVDCYDNPAEQCHCEICRNNGESIKGWMDIESAPLDHDIQLAVYITPSPEAHRNGSRASWAFGEGRYIGHTWTGILGGNPSHWKEITPKGPAPKE